MDNPELLKAIVEIIKTGGAYGVLAVMVYCWAPAVIFCSGTITVTGAIMFLKRYFKCPCKSHEAELREVKDENPIS